MCQTREFHDSRIDTSVLYQFGFIVFQRKSSRDQQPPHVRERSFVRCSLGCELHVVVFAASSASSSLRVSCPICRVLLFGPVSYTGLSDCLSNCSVSCFAILLDCCAHSAQCALCVVRVASSASDATAGAYNFPDLAGSARWDEDFRGKSRRCIGE